MRLEWIEDILAVLDDGSLAHAAEKRLLTQSAFTRRVRQIEENVGSTLFDRSRKPVTVLPGVQALEPEMRDVAVRLRQLRQLLKDSSLRQQISLRVACQHALSTTISPAIVDAVSTEDLTVRFLSGNRDESLLLLLSNAADLAVVYEFPEDRSTINEQAFETVELGTDPLIPVCAPTFPVMMDKTDTPVIRYPSDVFFGQVFDRAIARRIPNNFRIMPKAETELTLAMRQFARRGHGIAWLPHSLVSDDLERNHLKNLDGTLPTQPMLIKMVRPLGNRIPELEEIWHRLRHQLRVQPESNDAPSQSN